MSFFEDSRFKYHNDYETRKLYEEKKRLEEELKDRQWRERNAEYEREQQHYREQEERQSRHHAGMEERMNLVHTARDLQDKLEDLRLRRKFGIEEE